MVSAILLHTLTNSAFILIPGSPPPLSEYITVAVITAVSECSKEPICSISLSIGVCCYDTVMTTTITLMHGLRVRSVSLYILAISLSGTQPLFEYSFKAFWC